MKIENGSLVVTVKGVEKTIPLPAVAADAKVKAWAVPADYRADGLFVAVTVKGDSEEIPACDLAACEFLGELELDAGDDAKLEAVKAAKRIEINEACNSAVAALAASCPERDEKQSAIDVWEGRYADKTAECEKLKAERDKLAAQIERMREALMLGATVIDPDDCPTITQEMHEALALPDLSTSILNRMRAETAERCAEVCDVHATGWKASPGCNPMAGFIASSNCATDIRALSHDMEAGK